MIVPWMEFAVNLRKSVGKVGLWGKIRSFVFYMQV